jgi:hypothetical protein
VSTWEKASREVWGTVALLHVGFARPDTESVDAFLEVAEQGLHVTAAARHALPSECRVSARSVGRCGGRDIALQDVYRALGTWLGATVGPEFEPLNSSGAAQEGTPLDCTARSQDCPIAAWITRLEQSEPNTFNALVEAGICSDEDFVRERERLEEPVIGTVSECKPQESHLAIHSR